MVSSMNNLGHRHKYIHKENFKLVFLTDNTGVLQKQGIEYLLGEVEGLRKETQE